MTISRKERIVKLLERASDIYEKFLQIVEDDIIEPLARGDKDQCRENLRKFGKKVTVAEVIRIVVRGANLLSTSMIKSLEAMPEKGPGLSEEYIKSRLEYFANRKSQLTKIDKSVAPAI